jgi:hypothetical protein
MSETSSSSQPAATPSARPAPEFFARLNDVLAVANRIGRKHDTAHAQLVLSHALARYSAHHYKNTVKADSPDERKQFGNYMGSLVAHLIGVHMPEIMGDADTPPEESATPAPGESTPE